MECVGNIFKDNKSLTDLFKEFESFEEDSEGKLQKEEINYLEPSQLRISTMTATCETCLILNLKSIYKYGQIIDYNNNEEGIIKIEYGDENIKGTSKKDIEKRKEKKKKVFYNQATIIIKIMSGNKIKKEVNMKIFTNGNLQMTGLKSIDDGKKAVQIFFESCTQFNAIVKNKETGELKTVKAIDNPGDFQIKNFQIVLINSDYSIYFKIKRDVLHNILQKKYKIFSSYEPCIYPGVNSKYYWNNEYLNNQTLEPGVCHCTKTCTGKGKGYGNGECKKITISAFQSGNVIITGARSEDQIKDAYNFINKIFKDNYSLIKRDDTPFLTISDSDDEREMKYNHKKKKIVYLKKSNIQLSNKYK
jgi:TATA-box binding protein (TBP) (component of TFIID and TFIIIB)